MGSQFLKEHSPVLTEVFGANSNLQVGNPAHLFYNTLYTSKNSQNEDQSRYNVIATSIIRRIVRLHQDARIQQDGSQDQADYLEGLCRFLSGMTAAMSKDIVSSRFAENYEDKGQDTRLGGEPGETETTKEDEGKLGKAEDKEDKEEED